VVCLITASLTYVIGQMKGIGVAFSRFLEVDFGHGLLAGMTIVFVYAVLGGMKGVTYTQIAQYCVLIFAYTVPAIFISMHLTGNPIPQLGLGGTMADGVLLLDKLDKVLVDLGFKAYTIQKGSTMNMFCLTMSLMIGTAGLPHVITRFFTVPKVKDARSSAGWALVFIAILYPKTSSMKIVPTGLKTGKKPVCLSLKTRMATVVSSTLVIKIKTKWLK
jgi:cation/acetate symporter